MHLKNAALYIVGLMAEHVVYLVSFAVRSSSSHWQGKAILSGVQTSKKLYKTQGIKTNTL